MDIIVYSIIAIIIFSFIWNIKENFGQSYLWIPTRNTRLMSYDLRGDPFGSILYPADWNMIPWNMSGRIFNVPYVYYAFKPSRYDINGRYIVPKIKKKVIKKREIKKTPVKPA